MRSALASKILVFMGYQKQIESHSLPRGRGRMVQNDIINKPLHSGKSHVQKNVTSEKSVNSEIVVS
jgi:hypothetical protein